MTTVQPEGFSGATKPINICMDCAEDKVITSETLNSKEKEKQDAEVAVWKPSVLSTIGKEIHYFAGHEIKMWESFDSFGSIIWPAALALCRYLESNRQVDLHDKAVLEIGAGTGLVSVVASLLGAWVTATDLPEVLGNLRCNLSRNTRGHCRYTPQAAGLFWGHELEKTFPQSVYRYDYVLAADVVYYHDFLEELLVTMRHFCQPGTTLIWANKIRFEADLVFLNNFKKTFNTNLLEDTGDIKIYSATMKEENRQVTSEVIEEVVKQEKEVETFEMIKGAEENHESKSTRDMKPETKTGNVEIHQQNEDVERNSEIDSTDQTYTEHKSEEETTETDKQQDYLRTWAPTVYSILPKEMYHFLGQQIIIQESIDSYGATTWPAALALCRFLETAEGRQQINLFDKSVLELGAGTGLLSVVATLLGAKLTATDLPEILSNLTCNLNRNTRGHQRHEPLVTELFWGHRLEETFPRTTHHYDYVLATDVVYHHDHLAELLATMCHFCQPGTTLVWANKVRYATDLGFIDNFHQCFNTTLLAELDEVRIYVATSRATADVGVEKDIGKSEKCDIWEDVEDQRSRHDKDHEDLESRTQNSEDHSVKGGNNKEVENLKTERSLLEFELQPEQTHSSESGSDEKQEHDIQNCERSQENIEDSAEPGNTQVCQKFWAPTVYYKPNKEIYYYLGYEISIQESIDSYGAMIWPAALALCSFLDTPAGRNQINLLDKSTLELGAGTGLVSIVATLLGAKLTATDLPEILGNLRSNLNRNTRRYWKHEPQVVALSWGHKLEETFPRSTYHYDYVLAADVVYHHDYLAELLVTMRHFCQRGTTLIWANKVRYQSDLLFLENFQKAFNTTLLTEMDEVRIYSATTRRSDDEHEARDREE